MELKAEIRARKGKQGAKKLRLENKIPAILYGHKEKSLMLQVAEKDIRLIGRSEKLTLDFGEKVDVLLKATQWDPISSKIMHLDFQRLHKGEKVKTKVPIIFEGTPIGVKEQGGILEHILSEIEIECLPKDIQEEIKIDVSNLKIGDSIHLKDLPPAKGEFITDLASAIVTILAPKVVEEKPPEEVVPEAEVSEEEKTEGSKEQVKPA